MVNGETINKAHKTMMSITKKIRLSAKHNLHPYNITPLQFQTLFLLDCERSLYVKELVTELNIKPSAATLIVDRLSEQELVHRYHDKKDRRMVKVELATKGRALVREVKGKHLEMLTAYFSVLAPKEQETLVDLLGKLEKNIPVA
ncbi:MarR family winged helix-turn-helix transcriptional regulator [Priestia endophytica]|jgi:MarR family transcriptional regulator, organic hydroperoxide resistance regulator|uniref:MarR family winged helix-turn-helix transcriptional regulator n=1 Tax=Priestia endophytica TaxID=135735 RepID=UPI000F5329A5|nr:MarR family transcriptional regulator [Priestia endophytica]MED4069704.1 MarR family transcriptional regulator [Priestia endophytica]RPK14862.1 hypothetical protein FH5_00297 [Priestia endophytica]